MAILDDVRSVLAPPHFAGRSFIVGGLIAFLLGFVLGSWLTWLGLIFTMFCLFFFRDAEVVPPPRGDLFLAPADGRVVAVVPAVPPAELGLTTDPRWKISI